VLVTARQPGSHAALVVHDLRLVRALAVELHEDSLEAHHYLNMDDLREHKKGALRMAA
jgi:hypothetical protein